MPAAVTTAKNETENNVLKRTSIYITIIISPYKILNTFFLILYSMSLYTVTAKFPHKAGHGRIYSYQEPIPNNYTKTEAVHQTFRATAPDIHLFSITFSFPFFRQTRCALSSSPRISGVPLPVSPASAVSPHFCRESRLYSH